jgi:hypothetical protein
MWGCFMIGRAFFGCLFILCNPELPAREWQKVYSMLLLWKVNKVKENLC